MNITYDLAKNSRNILERNLSFDCARYFDFTTALIKEDQRKDYGEKRYIAFGFLKSRLHILVFTETSIGIRVISLRKANQREVLSYEQYQNIAH